MGLPDVREEHALGETSLLVYCFAQFCARNLNSSLTQDNDDELLR